MQTEKDDTFMLDICLCNYASQPDIKLLCDGSWTTPSWQTKTVHKDIVAQLPPDCYIGDNGRCYTFELKNVTCKKCLLEIILPKSEDDKDE